MKSSLCFHKYIFPVLAATLLAGCGTVRRLTYPYKHTYLPTSSKKEGFSKDYPNSFTIYPFMNISWDKNAGIRGRRAIFEAFSIIAPCARMEDTDKLASTPYNFDDAMKVARKQKSDAVVIGEVINQEQSFLFLYAYNYVELKVTVYDTRSGLPFYTATGWSMSNEFGGMIFWIPNPILPMIENIFWSRVTMDLYHRITMDMVHDMRPELLLLPE